MKAYRIAEIVNSIKVISEQSTCYLAEGSDAEMIKYYQDKMRTISEQIYRLDNSFCRLVDNLLGKE